MKTKIIKSLFVLGFILLLIACSTKRDTFLARNYHALTSKYNILYNGQVGFNKGFTSIDAQNKDNYWSLLPVENMQIIEEDTATNEKAKNPDFDLAETKATKAIQKHSMNIGGKEKNYQIDEAYLMLGKSRYYAQRFVPALDAFNYILYKYPNSSNINQAKIWREKTNMRLGNDAQVVKNISKLLKNKKLKNQVIADANALLAQAFLNLEEKDSTVAKLKIAEKFTKANSEKARYRFILGQLHEQLGEKGEAIARYESVIRMKRKAKKEYTIQAQAKKAALFDFEKGDTIAFLKTYNDLIKDRENRPFLDVIYHQLGLFYDKRKQQKSAEEFYNLSLRKEPKDKYLSASNYRNIGNMYFRKANYASAAKYYDSTLVHLAPKTREYIHIQKVRKDLDEVISLENIAKVNDSILSIVAMSESEKNTYFETYIQALKKADEVKKIALEKEKATQDNIANNEKSNAQSQETGLQDASGKAIKKVSMLPPAISPTASNQTASAFYFYNPTQVSFGKIEFKKKWGNRASGGYWRITAVKEKVANDSIEAETNPIIADKKNTAEEKIEEKYTADFYIKKLPQAQVEIDSIQKERNFAYYQIGVIYKEKFKENQLATNKLEQLLQQNPEEKLILPTMYHLYKLYQITDAAKTEDMKRKITSLYPDSRYAQIINNTTQSTISENENSDRVYNKVYRLFQEEQFTAVLQQLEGLISQYTGNEIVPKFELLKANTLGKIKGLDAYKNAMQHVADNYPNTEEGKKAQEVLTQQIPMLEGMEFSDTDTKKWKVIYKVPLVDENAKKALETKIKTFLEAETPKILTHSIDKYSEKDGFVTIHNINSELYGNAILNTLKEKFKVTETGVVVSDVNYNVIQIKKNLESYSASKKL